ncbi:hypothetical protein KKG71_02295 [Patescibacteria group bacterium]|nr:hypothetical protein [Patescibacteria group bacterium]
MGKKGIKVRENDLFPNVTEVSKDAEIIAVGECVNRNRAAIDVSLALNECGLFRQFSCRGIGEIRTVFEGAIEYFEEEEVLKLCERFLKMHLPHLGEQNVNVGDLPLSVAIEFCDEIRKNAELLWKLNYLKSFDFCFMQPDIFNCDYPMDMIALFMSLKSFNDGLSEEDKNNGKGNDAEKIFELLSDIEVSDLRSDDYILFQCCAEIFLDKGKILGDDHLSQFQEQLTGLISEVFNGVSVADLGAQVAKESQPNLDLMEEEDEKHRARSQQTEREAAALNYELEQVFEEDIERGGQN